MCLGVPGRVLELLPGGVARVELADGVVIEADAGAIEGVRVGDTVIVHAGIIIARLDERGAEEMIEAVEELVEDLERKAESFEELLRSLGVMRD